LRSHKSSKAAWLDRIPSDWTEAPLFTYFRQGKRKNTGMAETNVLSLSYGSIKRRDVDSGLGLLPESFETYQIVEPGNIVMRLTDLQNDQRSLRTGLVKERGIVTSAYLALIPSERVDARFAHYLLHALDTMKVFYGLGAGVRQTMNYADLSGIPLAMPSKSAQRLLADYLDRETARVDTLIDRKQRFIDLLLEKRSALITHAVTKGLDSHVEMKDSGVGWIGTIPAHWDAVRMKQVARLESGHTPSRQHPEYWIECHVPWITTSEVWQVRDGRAEYITETKECVSELGLANSSARRLPAGTVVLSRTASVGFSAIMPVEMATSQDFADWVPGPSVISEYLLYVLRSMRGEFDRLMMGSTHQTIYMPDIQKLSMPLPSLGEQKQIVVHIRHEARTLDGLIDRTRQSIELLKAYRTALISAAVTGQIDIPGINETEDVA